MDARERQSQAAEIEALIQEVTAWPDSQTRAKTERLLQALLEMYGEGLARVLALTSQAEVAGPTLIETFARDELVGSLLLLHGLHPVELETRVHRAVEEVRGSVKTHGDTVELLRVEDGIAYVQLAGSCRGCASSTGALKQRVEGAIYRAAPDLDDIRVVEHTAPRQMPVPARFVPPRKRQKQTPVAEQVETRPDRASVPRTR